MSFVIAAPDVMAAAASDLANIGSTIGSANMAAAAATSGVLPAAADEVSAEIAALFSAHAAGYQQLSAAASAFHQQFVEALNLGASTYAAAEANVVQTLASAAPALGVDLGGGLAGLEASLTAEVSGLSAGLGAALSGNFGGSLSGLAPLGAALTADLNGGLTALTQTGAALSGGLGSGLSGLAGLPALLAGLAAPWQALLSAASPAAFLAQLETMELGFNSALLNAELGFNGLLTANELGIEAAIFGNVSNGVFNSFYNFWNSLLGGGEAALNALMGVQVPAGLLTGSLLVGASPIIGGGALGGLLLALPTKFLWDLEVFGAAVGGALTLPTALGVSLTGAISGAGVALGGMLNGSLFAGLPLTGAALIAAPIGGLQGIGTMEAGLLGNLVGAETAFNTSLLTNEIAWETGNFGTASAFNGALNRAFNVGNLLVSTGEQTVNGFLGGSAVPGLFLTGSGEQVFNAGNIGGIEGIFDQSLAFGADLAGML